MTTLFKNGPITVYLPDHFPIRIDPIDDECLSSWIIRVATFYYLLPWDFLCAANGGAFLNSQDLDKQLPESLLESLSRLTGVRPDTIEALTQYRRYPALNQRWLRSFTDNGEVARCEECLNEMYDKNGFAYLKADWQLRCVTTCHLHRIPLISVCGTCRHFVSLEYIENRNRWEVICRRCSLKHIQKSAGAIRQHISSHFVMEIEQLFIASLRDNRSYLHPFHEGDARSLMCAISDMLQMNRNKKDILNFTQSPITSSPRDFYTELEFDHACLLDVLQMTADKKTRQYIWGDQIFSDWENISDVSSRLTEMYRTQWLELPDLLERSKEWPSALRQLAEHTWITIAPGIRT